MSRWRSSKPPVTAKDYEARSAEFMHRFGRPFRSATNAGGEPRPQIRGAKEKLVIENIQAGTYYFALKTWSHVPSVSDLSNVVMLDVH